MPNYRLQTVRWENNMLGAIIGDIVGSVYERYNINWIKDKAWTYLDEPLRDACKSAQARNFSTTRPDSRSASSEAQP